MNGEEEKGFKVTDRRTFGKGSSEETEAPPQEAARAADQPREPEAGTAPPPPVGFLTFLQSLAASTLISLGVVPDPVSGEVQTSLGVARQTIDVLAMLREKTRGNLTESEQKFFDHILAELQMHYVQKAGGSTPDSP